MYLLFHYILLLFQTQFVMLVTHTTVNIFTDCDFPQGYNYAVALYVITLIILFGNFYYKAYVIGKAKKRDA